MTHDEYIKRRDEALEQYKTAITDTSGDAFYQEERIVESQKAIDELVLAVIGEDEAEDIDLSKSAKSRWGVRARNRVRIEQRSIVKGGE